MPADELIGCEKCIGDCEQLGGYFCKQCRSLHAERDTALAEVKRLRQRVGELEELLGDAKTYIACGECDRDKCGNCKETQLRNRIKKALSGAGQEARDEKD